MPTEPDCDPLRVSADAIARAIDACARARQTAAEAADLREQARRLREVRPGRLGRGSGAPVPKSNPFTSRS
jgi:hypothetical protein